MIEQVIIHAAGACCGEPGPGGFCATANIWGSDHMTVSGGDPETTSLDMELTALTKALNIAQAMIRREEAKGVRTLVHTGPEAARAAGQGFPPSPRWDQLREVWKEMKPALLDGGPDASCAEIPWEQAEFARTQLEPWRTVGMPRARKEPTPEERERVLEARLREAESRANRAMSILEATFGKLEDSLNFESFRDKLRELEKREIEW